MCTIIFLIIIFRRGDYILTLNGTDLRFQTTEAVQNALQEAPRGIARMVLSAKPPQPEEAIKTPEPPIDLSKSLDHSNGSNTDDINTSVFEPSEIHQVQESTEKSLNLNSSWSVSTQDDPFGLFEKKEETKMDRALEGKINH